MRSEQPIKHEQYRAKRKTDHATVTAGARGCRGFYKSKESSGGFPSAWKSFPAPCYLFLLRAPFGEYSRSLHWALPVYRSRLAPWTRGGRTTAPEARGPRTIPLRYSVGYFLGLAIWFFWIKRKANGCWCWCWCWCWGGERTLSGREREPAATNFVTGPVGVAVCVVFLLLLVAFVGCFFSWGVLQNPAGEILLHAFQRRWFSLDLWWPLPASCSGIASCSCMLACAGRWTQPFVCFGFVKTNLRQLFRVKAVH